jgi:hypothetical protein
MNFNPKNTYVYLANDGNATPVPGGAEFWSSLKSTNIQSIELRDSCAILVPRGIWHTAKVHTPSRMLHITMGEGTESRSI